MWFSGPNKTSIHDGEDLRKELIGINSPWRGLHGGCTGAQTLGFLIRGWRSPAKTKNNIGSLSSSGKCSPRGLRTALD
jgi:hypothetical protein